MADVERDEISGTDTTGHEWDGIKELNTPLPRWWILTFYATIVWALLLFHTTPGIRQLIGGITVLIGVLVVTYKPRKAT